MDILGYSDGSCDPSTRKGGWGCVIYTPTNGELCLGFSNFGSKVDTTNNEMEMTGFLELLQLLPRCTKRCLLILDSQYCLRTISKADGRLLQVDGWCVKWDVLTNENSSRKNAQLWKKIILKIEDLLSNGIEIYLRWQKSHNGEEGNEFVDSLANQGRHNN